MKKKSLFLALGSGVILGIISMLVLRDVSEDSNKTEISANPTKSTKTISKKSKENIQQSRSETDHVINLNETRINTAKTIFDRHREATQVMDKSLNNIYTENVDNEIVSENKDEFDNLFEELNKL